MAPKITSHHQPATKKMPIKSYRDLKVWKDSVDMVTEIYKLMRKLPPNESYGLCSQIQRAAVSIPSNIAEGHARNSNKEFHRFLSISLGSLAELETQITITEKLAYLAANDVKGVLEQADKIGKMIRTLQKRIVVSHQQPETATSHQPPATSRQP